MPRGRTKYYAWGNSQRTISSLPDERRIFDLVPGRAYGSKREAIRAMLESGQLTYDMVSGLPDRGTVTRQDLYGSQRRRANLPLRRVTGEVMEGQRVTHDESYGGDLDPNERPLEHWRYGGLNRGRPLRNTRGEVIQGPRRTPKPKLRSTFSKVMVVNGKRVGARKALEFHPMLRDHVRQMGRQGVSGLLLWKD